MNETRLKIEYVPTASLKPYAGNAKEHPDWQIEQIKLSMEEFGNIDPIGIWRDEVVEGHGRLLAALDMGIETVPIIRLDHLSDDQRKAYAIVHNKLTMNTDFDLEKLQEELDAISTDLSGYGFDELEQLLNGPDAGGVIEDEYEPILPEEPKTKLGDLFKLGNHRLLCGDCTKLDFVQTLIGGVRQIWSLRIHHTT